MSRFPQFLTRCTDNFNRLFPSKFSSSGISRALNTFRAKFIHPVLDAVLPGYKDVYACRRLARAMSQIPADESQTTTAKATKAKKASFGLILVSILLLKLLVGSKLF